MSTRNNCNWSLQTVKSNQTQFDFSSQHAQNYQTDTYQMYNQSVPQNGYNTFYANAHVGPYMTNQSKQNYSHNRYGSYWKNSGRHVQNNHYSVPGSGGKPKSNSVSIGNQYAPVNGDKSSSRKNTPFCNVTQIFDTSSDLNNGRSSIYEPITPPPVSTNSNNSISNNSSDKHVGTKDLVTNNNDVKALLEASSEYFGIRIQNDDIDSNTEMNILNNNNNTESLQSVENVEPDNWKSPEEVDDFLKSLQLECESPQKSATNEQGMDRTPETQTNLSKHNLISQLDQKSTNADKKYSKIQNHVDVGNSKQQCNTSRPKPNTHTPNKHNSECSPERQNSASKNQSRTNHSTGDYENPLWKNLPVDEIEKTEKWRSLFYGIPDSGDNKLKSPPENNQSKCHKTASDKPPPGSQLPTGHKTDSTRHSPVQPNDVCQTATKSRERIREINREKLKLLIEYVEKDQRSNEEVSRNSSSGTSGLPGETAKCNKSSSCERKDPRVVSNKNSDKAPGDDLRSLPVLFDEDDSSLFKSSPTSKPWKHQNVSRDRRNDKAGNDQVKRSSANGPPEDRSLKKVSKVANLPSDKSAPGRVDGHSKEVPTTEKAPTVEWENETVHSSFEDPNYNKILRAFKKLKLHKCLVCNWTFPNSAFWINIVSGELRCLNCFRKKFKRQMMSEMGSRSGDRDRDRGSRTSRDKDHHSGHSGKSDEDKMRHKRRREDSRGHERSGPDNGTKRVRSESETVPHSRTISGGGGDAPTEHKSHPKTKDTVKSDTCTSPEKVKQMAHHIRSPVQSKGTSQSTRS